jgi:hypothetical protein
MQYKRIKTGDKYKKKKYQECFEKKKIYGLKLRWEEESQN